MKEVLRSCPTGLESNPYLEEWKEQGNRVLGYVCTNVPQELIHAAGFLPVRVLGREGPVREVGQYFPGSTCHVAKSIYDMGLSGSLSFLDGMVTTFCCDAIRALAYCFEQQVDVPFFYFLSRPQSSRAAGHREFFIHELKDLRSRLEEFSGREITDENLKASIALYNENRRLLQKLARLRGQEDLPRLSGFELARLVMAGFWMPKEKHNRFLRAALEVAENRSPVGQEVLHRLHLSGSVLFDPQLFQILEESGAVVVSDDLCVGMRSYRGEVDPALEPLEGLAAYYSEEEIECSFMHSENRLTRRFGKVKEMIEENKVRGVIFAVQRWCDPHLLDHPEMEAKLTAAHVPSLFLEVEQTMDTLPLRNRIEAFLETLEALV